MCGESVGSIAARLNLTVNGIRKHAARKGWTRTRHAEAMKRSEHPGQALSTLLARVGRAVQEGRMEDVGPLVDTAWRLSQSVRHGPPLPPLEPSREAQEAWRRAETKRLEARVWSEAQRLAEEMLKDPPRRPRRPPQPGRLPLARTGAGPRGGRGGLPARAVWRLVEDLLERGGAVEGGGVISLCRRARPAPWRRP